VAAHLDFPRLREVEREFILEDWRGRESDRLFEIPYVKDGQSSEVLVCVLVEHQSRPDPRMPLRVLLYAVLYWERRWRQWETEGGTFTLRPILPIVFHTGRFRWTTTRELADLMEGPEELRSFAPHWPILFWDLAEHAVEDLLAATGEWIQSLAIVRGNNRTLDEFHELIREVLARFSGMPKTAQVRMNDLVRFVLAWAFRNRPQSEHDDLRKIAIDAFKTRKQKREVRKMIDVIEGSWADDLLKEGREEGREEGRLQGARENILTVLEARFNVVPDSLRSRLSSMTDLQELKSLIRQAALVPTLDDLSLPADAAGGTPTDSDKD
jgi:hypothetical protein